MNKRSKPLITFVIFAYNESHRIEYPIKNYLPYGNVVVWDNMSTDDTGNIAKELGARVIRKHRPEDFAEHENTVNHLKKHVETPWIFWGYADEMVPAVCLEKYQEIAMANRYKIVIQKRKTVAYDYKHEYLPTYTCIKFFRSDALDFTGNSIHQMGNFASHVKPKDICYLPPLDEYSVYHFSTHTTKNIINSFTLYAQSHGDVTSARFAGIKLIIAPIMMFLRMYIVEGAFRYGIEGIMMSIHYSYYMFLINAVAYEQGKKKTTHQIEKNFSIKKKELLLGNPQTFSLWKPVALAKIKLVKYIYTKKKFAK